MEEVIQSFECVVTGKNNEYCRVRLINLSEQDDDKIIEIPFTSLPFGERDLSIGQSFYWDVLNILSDDGTNVSVYSIPDIPYVDLDPDRIRARELALRQLMFLDTQEMRIH